MRAAVILVLVLALCAMSDAYEQVIDLNTKPEAGWHVYVGKRCTISGTFVRFGKFGRAIKASEGSLYIIHWPKNVPELDDQEPILVEGLLHFHPPTPSKPHSNGSPGFYYFLHRESVIRVPVT